MRTKKNSYLFLNLLFAFQYFREEEDNVKSLSLIILNGVNVIKQNASSGVKFGRNLNSLNDVEK